MDQFTSRESPGGVTCIKESDRHRVIATNCDPMTVGGLGLQALL